MHKLNYPRFVIAEEKVLGKEMLVPVFDSISNESYSMIVAFKTFLTISKNGKYSSPEKPNERNNRAES